MAERESLGEKPVPLSAAVLAGGASRRMGKNKALVSLTSGGPPLLALVLASLAQVATDVFVVADDNEKYQEFDVRVVADCSPGIGALGGIQTAIQHATQEHCLIVACDMPFLNVHLLQQMAAAPRDYDVLVPLLPGKSRQRADGLVFQTLHAIYGRRCLPYIEARIAEGQRQVVGFFADVRVRTMGAAEVTSLDPDLQSFFNANDPQSLAQASDIHAARERGA